MIYKFIKLTKQFLLIQSHSISKKSEANIESTNNQTYSLGSISFFYKSFIITYDYLKFYLK